MSELPTITLDRLQVGKDALIAEIRGDRKLTRQLLGLGIRVGSRIRIMQQRGKGVVVACDGNRVALGATIAHRLYTRPAGEAGSTQ
ncbi:MAG: ferrous iron transport protein A [Gammaproteobacteria bacterium]|nr:ferrous iron transport protein A [Gammaproteobacteria bacterium]